MYISYAVSFLSPSSIAYPKGSSPLKKFWSRGQRRNTEMVCVASCLFAEDLGRQAFTAVF